MGDNFNLLSEPWLPALFEGEGLPRDVSIQEALARAHDIIKLGNESPLETISMHRLLLAITHRVFPIRDDEEWQELWEAGSFNQASVDAYLGPVSDRFELFGDEHPFFQNPRLPDGYATTIAKLGHQFSSGNNPALFDHSIDDAPSGVTPAQAARLLLAQQSFAVGGLLTRLKEDPPSAEASHLLKSAVVLLTGRNLFETIVLNMVVLDGRQEEPFAFEPEEDRPAWEQDPPSAAERPLLGYLDLLTWQSRRVRLVPPADDGLVRKVVVMAGWKIAKPMHPAECETMVAYGKNEKAVGGQDPRPPVGFRPERVLWRDSESLLRQADDHGRPRTLRHLRNLVNDGYVAPDATIGLAAFGLSSDRAKLFLWREEQYAFPMAFVADEGLLSTLWHSVGIAERGRDQLMGAVYRMAEKALAPTGSADRERVRKLVDALGAERVYWPGLDVPFRNFIRELAETFADDQGAATQAAWGQTIRESASEAFAHAARALQTSGRGFRAAAEVEPAFRAGLVRATSQSREDSEQQ